MIPVIFALISAFSYGVVNITIAYPSKKLGYNLFLFLRSLTATFLIFLVWLFFIHQQTFSFYGVFLALLISLVGYIGLYFLYKAFAVGKVGLVSPIISAHPIVSIVIAILFLNEIFVWNRFLLVLVILFGMVLLTINFKDFKESNIFKLETGVPFAFVTVIFFGLAFSFWGSISLLIGSLSMALLIELGNFMWTGIVIFFQKQEKSKKLNLKYLKSDKKFIRDFLLHSLGVVFGTVFQVFALTLGQISQVSIVLSTSTLFTILLARVFCKKDFR